MQWRLFADLAEVAGSDTVEIDDFDGERVQDALDALLEQYPSLESRILDDDGTLQDHINVLLNGESIHSGAGLETPVDPADELALFPPVSGG